MTINIPFAEALEQMPNFAKFTKQILSKKTKQEEFEIVAINEECRATKETTYKAKGSRDIYHSLFDWNRISSKALCYLGASIYLMPLPIYKGFELGDVKSTIVKLQLVDKSYIFPRGEIKDILVKVDKFIFRTYLLVLYMEDDKDVPIIMGRPFLATRKTLIDVAPREMIMRVNED